MHAQTKGNVTKPFNCKKCNQGFGRIWDLERHLLTHSGDRPFQCQYCERGYNRRDALLRHLRQGKPGHPKPKPKVRLHSMNERPRLRISHTILMTPVNETVYAQSMHSITKFMTSISSSLPCSLAFAFVVLRSSVGICLHQKLSVVVRQTPPRSVLFSRSSHALHTLFSSYTLSRLYPTTSFPLVSTI
ncbi:hypothetical protein EXIGLDRAFT_515620 [Exidia glandulosa HHB12029]|uniref:C2H2-type domain-containing protein n=1 Tax=Exidia glandulosa HHB12029 TaxID=1314781 RepID=A0A165J9H6_EXIGL|nr:hypothetical protein EXIGLDRAFT_515620 [Exidia glandulosa HHB12029]